MIADSSKFNKNAREYSVKSTERMLCESYPFIPVAKTNLILSRTTMNVLKLISCAMKKKITVFKMIFA